MRGDLQLLSSSLLSFLLGAGLQSVSAAPRDFFFNTLKLPPTNSYFAGSISDDIFGLAAEGDWVGHGTPAGLFRKPLKQALDAMFAVWVESSFKPLLETAPIGEICTVYGKECYYSGRGTKYSTTMYILRSSSCAIFVGPVSVDPALEPGESYGKVLAEYDGSAAWKAFRLLDRVEASDYDDLDLGSGWGNVLSDVSDWSGDVCGDLFK